MEPQVARRNVRLGWLLLAIFVLFFAGTVAVAFLYLQFD
jgi:disulfide bond formation protein DsbB